MRDRDDVELVVEREVEGDTRAEAVADRAEPDHALLLERAHDALRDLDDARVGVLAEPGHEVEVGARVQRVRRDRVAVEQVGQDDLEAIARIVVGKELRSERRNSVGSVIFVRASECHPRGCWGGEYRRHR